MTDEHPRYVPEFRLRIGGAAAPAALRASTTSVSLESGLEGADRLELQLTDPQLRWLQDPLLRMDTPISLELGYLPGPLTQLFAGEVVTRSPSFPSGGAPSLTVAAQDRIRRLQRGEKVRWFAIPTQSIGNFPLPDTAVAGIVAAENLLMPVLDPVGAALSVILGGAEMVAAMDDPGSLQRVIRKQEGESDFDFLTKIARQNGWEMKIDHAEPAGGFKLRFFSPLDHLMPDVTLVRGRSLIDFTPRITSVGQIASVTAYVWVSQIKTSFEVTVGWDWDRMSLSLQVLPALMPANKDASRYELADPVTAFTAPRAIVAELIPRLNQRLTGRGSTVGDPRIVPGSVLRLEGLGEEFGGLYRVTSASHTLDGSGYRTSFEVRKEIWFGSIPLSEQGAVPVRVAA